MHALKFLQQGFAIILERPLAKRGVDCPLEKSQGPVQILLCNYEDFVAVAGGPTHLRTLFGDSVGFPVRRTLGRLGFMISSSSAWSNFSMRASSPFSSL